MATSPTPAAGGRRVIRVLHLTTGVVFGGGEKHILTLFEAPPQPGIELQLVVLHEGHLAAEARRRGVNVHVVAKRFRGDFRIVWQLRQLMREERIDVVHTHLLGGNLYGRLAARWARVPVLITTLHCVTPAAIAKGTTRLTDRLFFACDVAMSRLCTMLVSPSEVARKRFIDMGVPEERIVTVHNGIDVTALQAEADKRAAARAAFGLKPETVAVGMMGRLVPVKNFPLFINAAATLVKTRPGTRFLIIGEGVQGDELARRIAEHGVQESVQLVGFQEDVGAVLSALDIVVLCSNSEVYPYTIPEAMSLGRAVVATRVGGIPEQIRSGEDGMLCEAGDLDGLVDALDRLIGDRELRDALGSEASQRATRDFDVSATAEGLARLYRSTVPVPEPTA